MNWQGAIRVSPAQLAELRANPLFIAYAPPPSGKVIGGMLGNKKYLVKKSHEKDQKA
jgi:hypothetical protein